MIIFSLGVLSLFITAAARQWRNSGTGTIVLEEAWTVPELVDLITATPPLGEPFEEFKASFLDVHGRRLDLMDQNNIDFMVLSCATPCIQGISDPAAAAAMAVNVNNQLAAAISNNTARFGGFASLSMHNAAEAAQELRRSVKELGLLGALLNDYQQSGLDNTTLLYYDQPEYDVFWQAVTDLDVPVYFHPRVNIAQIRTLMYNHAPFIRGPSEEYAVTLANHILGLCTNGVFDRFPTLKVIVGHLGERLPSDLFRIDEQLRRARPNGLVMQQNASAYWRTNLYETTSGNFATSLLKFHINEIGLDRIMYSVDYPFSGEIRAPIHYDDGRASLDPSPHGEPSITEWELVASSALFAQPTVPLSLLRLKLHTGHKHQLRVHLARCLNTPILGDALYSKKPPSESINQITMLPEDRIFLHASHLSFFRYRPSGFKKRFRLGISAPLPPDFLRICSDSGIQVDPAEAKGGVFIDGIMVEDGKVPELEGDWMPELDEIQPRNKNYRAW
ncbi:hypothetical protein D9615_007949 [Tricholomella constricta]|uniref:Amidohydrolase-related domain-containing protein n=1 Tax=Tricholomella constricta TaxID=117010 RepID=A0A8H5H247_9AGAR|nr:hypothetical protein D9615_007949 [Tricholomella constricta]